MYDAFTTDDCERARIVPTSSLSHRTHWNTITGVRSYPRQQTVARMVTIAAIDRRTSLCQRNTEQRAATLKTTEEPRYPRTIYGRYLRALKNKFADANFLASWEET